MFSKKKMSWMMAAVLGLAAAAMAAGAETLEASAHGTSWGYVFEKGGPLMYVLTAMSVLAVALIIYYFIVLRPEQVAPKAFRRLVIPKIADGAWDEARGLCHEYPSPLAEVVLTALDYVETTPNKDPLLLKDLIEGEGIRQGTEIQVQPQYLLDLAIVSPMVGLLGSVFGMIRAFHAVALEMTVAKPIALAAGVSEALFATAGGLIIGIPAMVFYGHFRSRASKLVSHLEAGSSQVLTAFLKGR